MLPARYDDDDDDILKYVFCSFSLFCFVELVLSTSIYLSREREREREMERREALVGLLVVWLVVCLFGWLVGWVLWHINTSRLFNAESCLYINIKDI